MNNGRKLLENGGRQLAGKVCVGGFLSNSYAEVSQQTFTDRAGVRVLMADSDIYS